MLSIVLKHALNVEQLQQDVKDSAPEVAETILNAKALVRYAKKSGFVNQLSTTVKQMEETR